MRSFTLALDDFLPRLRESFRFNEAGFMTSAERETEVMVSAK